MKKSRARAALPGSRGVVSSASCLPRAAVPAIVKSLLELGMRSVIQGDLVRGCCGMHAFWSIVLLPD
ncbi:hypothetical protein [Paenibacillus tarimensis]|uniref:hypothetical protein n=1 Tax=Paenibacillus tarimensis TaxID=416012 RepID=UPI001F2B1FFD|nr:hypothetical protein [Paenibacillus tarimensis]MCF2944216.1 hypothetical protein [Paenibacillus tarimensis]